MSWQHALRGDSLSWLLEPDVPGVRYLALRDLLDVPEGHPDLVAARKLAHQEGPIARVLEKMEPEGYWVKPGPGYGPKYRSSVWAMILLAQMGASIHEDARISRACGYMLDHALAPGGQFSHSGAPSGTFDCLQGNLLWSLMTLGCSDSRLQTSYEWAARTVTGEGLAPMTEKRAEMRYYAYKCAPNFACGANNRLPCAWGAVKVMLAFGKLPPAWQSPFTRSAIQQGIEFLLGIDPVTAAYPTPQGTPPSRDWWLFGFPVFYVTDILQILEALTALGFGRDARLRNALDLVCQKQDENGRWLLEYDYTGKTWMSFGRKKQPNKWVTLRALRVLKAAG